MIMLVKALWSQCVDIVSLPRMWFNKQTQLHFPPALSFSSSLLFSNISFSFSPDFALFLHPHSIISFHFSSITLFLFLLYCRHSPCYFSSFFFLFTSLSFCSRPYQPSLFESFFPLAIPLLQPSLLKKKTLFVFAPHLNVSSLVYFGHFSFSPTR